MTGETSLQVRCASEADLTSLFEWRNDPATRKMSFNVEPITFAAHEAWFLRSLSNPDRVIVIGECAGQRVGMVRFDLDSSAVIVAINLNPEFRGKSLSAPFLVAAEALLPRDWEVDLLRAEVKPTNLPSCRSFERAGYIRLAAMEGQLAHSYTKGLGARQT